MGDYRSTETGQCGRKFGNCLDERLTRTFRTSRNWRAISHSSSDNSYARSPCALSPVILSTTTRALRAPSSMSKVEFHWVRTSCGRSLMGKPSAAQDAFHAGRRRVVEWMILKLILRIWLGSK